VWLWEKLRLTLLLFGIIPYIGKDISFILWGGFSVDNPTLIRFFSLHYILPFVILAFVFIHLSFLHLEGSTNPLSLLELEFLPFYPYFFLKDLFNFFIILFVYFYFVFYMPNVLGHSDNYIEANYLVTPPHIVPE
jgi:ubiquinol-cytochrome c reductase cytochrome b subunit